MLSERTDRVSSMLLTAESKMKRNAVIIVIEIILLREIKVLNFMNHL